MADPIDQQQDAATASARQAALNSLYGTLKQENGIPGSGATPPPPPPPPPQLSDADKESRVAAYLAKSSQESQTQAAAAYKSTQTVTLTPDELKEKLSKDERKALSADAAILKLQEDAKLEAEKQAATHPPTTPVKLSAAIEQYNNLHGAAAKAQAGTWTTWDPVGDFRKKSDTFDAAQQAVTTAKAEEQAALVELNAKEKNYTDNETLFTSAALADLKTAAGYLPSITSGGATLLTTIPSFTPNTTQQATLTAQNITTVEGALKFWGNIETEKSAAGKNYKQKQAQTIASNDALSVAKKERDEAEKTLSEPLLEEAKSHLTLQQSLAAHEAAVAAAKTGGTAPTSGELALANVVQILQTVEQRKQQITATGVQQKQMKAESAKKLAEWRKQNPDVSQTAINTRDPNSPFGKLNHLLHAARKETDDTKKQLDTLKGELESLKQVIGMQLSTLEKEEKNPTPSLTSDEFTQAKAALTTAIKDIDAEVTRVEEEIEAYDDSFKANIKNEVNKPVKSDVYQSGSTLQADMATIPVLGKVIPESSIKTGVATAAGVTAVTTGAVITAGVTTTVVLPASFAVAGLTIGTGAAIVATGGLFLIPVAAVAAYYAYRGGRAAYDKSNFSSMLPEFLQSKNPPSLVARLPGLSKIQEKKDKDKKKDQIELVVGGWSTTPEGRRATVDRFLGECMRAGYVKTDPATGKKTLEIEFIENDEYRAALMVRAASFGIELTGDAMDQKHIKDKTPDLKVFKELLNGEETALKTEQTTFEAAPENAAKLSLKPAGPDRDAENKEIFTNQRLVNAFGGDVGDALLNQKDPGAASTSSPSALAIGSGAGAALNATPTLNSSPLNIGSGSSSNSSSSSSTPVQNPPSPMSIAAGQQAANTYASSSTSGSAMVINSGNTSMGFRPANGGVPSTPPQPVITPPTPTPTSGMGMGMGGGNN
jgi:hypothetical protein